MYEKGKKEILWKISFHSSQVIQRFDQWSRTRAGFGRIIGLCYSLPINWTQTAIFKQFRASWRVAGAPQRSSAWEEEDMQPFFPVRPRYLSAKLCLWIFTLHHRLGEAEKPVELPELVAFECMCLVEIGMNHIEVIIQQCAKHMCNAWCHACICGIWQQLHQYEAQSQRSRNFVWMLSLDIFVLLYVNKVLHLSPLSFWTPPRSSTPVCCSGWGQLGTECLTRMYHTYS